VRKYGGCAASSGISEVCGPRLAISTLDESRCFIKGELIRDDYMAVFLELPQARGLYKVSFYGISEKCPTILDASLLFEIATNLR
jgi:hypothetical protein